MASLFHRSLNAFLKVFFKLLYHQLAWTYDWVAATVSLGRWKLWVQSVLPYLPGPDVLEIGFGPGHLQAAMCAKGLKVFGLDESWDMNRLAFKRLIGLGFVPLVVNSRAQFIPFPDNSFNQVVATFPTDYIHQPQTLSEIRRILRPGGRLVVLPVAWITGGKLSDRAAASLFDVTGQPPEYDRRFILPFEQAGFDVRVETTNFGSSRAAIILADNPGKQKASSSEVG